MNIRTANWLTIIITAVVGIVFIVWHNEVNLFNWLVRALGLVLIVPGGYILMNSFGAARNAKISGSVTDGGRRVMTFKERSASTAMLVVSVVTIILGVFMLAVPTFFVGLIAYLLASVLVVYGVYQIVTLAYFCRPVVMPWYYYIVPAITVLTGIVIFVTPVRAMNTIVTLLTGLLLTFAAINWAMQRVTMRRRLARQQSSAVPDGTVPVNRQIEENVG